MADVIAVIEQKPQFKQSKKEVAELLDTSTKLEIVDEAGMNEANKFLIDVKRISKQLKDQKEDILAPMRKSENAVRDLFRPTETALEKVKTVLTKGILDVKIRLDEQAKKQEERILADKRIKKPETQMGKLAEIDTPVTTMYGSGGKSTFSEVKQIKIADISKIPQEYLERPNVQSALLIELRKDWFGNKAQGVEGKQIPGVEEYSEQRLSSSV